jgi:hypothetical protein
LTIYTLPDRPLACGIQASPAFWHHAIVPFPFRVQVRCWINDLTPVVPFANGNVSCASQGAPPCSRLSRPQTTTPLRHASRASTAGSPARRGRRLALPTFRRVVHRSARRLPLYAHRIRSVSATQPARFNPSTIAVRLIKAFPPRFWRRDFAGSHPIPNVQQGVGTPDASSKGFLRSHRQT